MFAVTINGFFPLSNIALRGVFHARRVGPEPARNIAGRREGNAGDRGLPRFPIVDDGGGLHIHPG